MFYFPSALPPRLHVAARRTVSLETRSRGSHLDVPKGTSCKGSIIECGNRSCQVSVDNAQKT